MRCDRVETLLPAYLDGDLSRRLSERVSAHLDSCESCQQAQAAQQSALRFLDSGRYVPSIDLWADFSRRLQQEPPPLPSPWRCLWQPGLASAVAAAVVALVTLSAPQHPGVSRWEPATAPVVQVARSQATLETETSQADLPFGPRLPRLAAPSARVVNESGPRALVAASDEPRRRRHSGQKRRPTARARRGDVLLARDSSPASVRPAPGDLRPNREGGSRALEVAALPPLPAEDGVMADADPIVREATTSGPLEAAEALMTAQQKEAHSQVQGELHLMARELALLSGGLPNSSISAESTGTGT